MGHKVCTRKAEEVMANCDPEGQGFEVALEPQLGRQSITRTSAHKLKKISPGWGDNCRPIRGSFLIRFQANAPGY